MAAREEVEVKLRLSARARAVLAAHPALQPPRAEPPETRAETSTYFDTESGRLAEAGASLRVRRAGNGALTQTLKLRPVVDGAAERRDEWEWPVATDTPDLGLLAGIDGIAALLASGEPILPLCATEIDRTAWHVVAGEDTAIEAVIDRGRIRAGEHSVAVNELELELKSGSPGALYRLALELAQAAPLMFEPAGKVERGARLAGRKGREPIKHGAVALDRSMTGAQAFRCIVSGAVGHLRRNLEPAARGHPEGVHQLRVAVRRLRAALALFKPMLGPTAERFDGALRRAGRVFGEARDWDVFVTETLPRAAVGGLALDRLRLLAKSAAPLRVAAHTGVARAMAAPRFTRLLLEMSAWAEEGATGPETLGTDPGWSQPATACAPDLLARLLRRATKRARGVEQADAAALHRLRKAMKTLRYGIEFTEALYRPKAVKALLKPAKRLQELLGEVNDAAATLSLAGRLAGDEAAGAAPALVDLSGWAAGRGAAAQPGVAKAWQALRKVDPFWE